MTNPATTVADVLTVARDLIACYDRWLRGAQASNMHGLRVEPASDAAVRWSADGAIRRATHNQPELRRQTMRAVSAATHELHDVDIVALNDVTAWQPETTHQSVIAAFDHAINKLRNQQ